MSGWQVPPFQGSRLHTQGQGLFAAGSSPVLVWTAGGRSALTGLMTAPSWRLLLNRQRGIGLHYDPDPRPYRASQIRAFSVSGTA